MNYLSHQEKLDFVRSQCKTIPGAKHHKDYTMICCPFHNDKNPSGRISHGASTKSPGYYKCYGCGKACKWDELAEALGLSPFATPAPRVRYADKIQIMDLEEAESDESEVLEFFDLPKHKRWRSISTDLLIDVGCRGCKVIYDSGFVSPNFIWMPVNIDNETVGYIKARMHKEPDKPSYINLKGSWVLTHGLFPFDYAISVMSHTKTVVLVEGQRDALRLLSMGIPAMCIMGTQSWSEQKCRLLELHGVERCIIFMDGDDAGISGTRKVHSLLSNYIPCRVLKLWEMKGSPYISKIGEMWDPGNCPESILLKLKQRYIL